MLSQLWLPIGQTVVELLSCMLTEMSDVAISMHCVSMLPDRPESVATLLLLAGQPKACVASILRIDHNQ